MLAEVGGSLHSMWKTTSGLDFVLAVAHTFDALALEAHLAACAQMTETVLEQCPMLPAAVVSVIASYARMAAPDALWSAVRARLDGWWQQEHAHFGGEGWFPKSWRGTALPRDASGASDDTGCSPALEALLKTAGRSAHATPSGDIGRAGDTDGSC